MKIEINAILTAPKEQQTFVAEYIGKVHSFQSHIYGYEFCTNKNATPIKNTDLWIDAYIPFIPALQDFRNYVLKEMKRLNIEPYSKTIYTSRSNHYVNGNEKKIHELENSLNLL